MQTNEFTFIQTQVIKRAEITPKGELYFDGELVETKKDIIKVLNFILKYWR